MTRAFPEGGPARVIALAWRTTDPRRGSLERSARFFADAAPKGTDRI